MEKSKSPLLIGSTYYSLLTDGGIVANYWVNDSVGNERYKLGNVYLSEEECEFAREKRIIEAEMERVSKNVPNSESWGECSYFLCLYDGGDLWISGWNCKYRRPQGVILFPTEESLQGIIDKFGKDKIKKYIFGVGI